MAVLLPSLQANLQEPHLQDSKDDPEVFSFSLQLHPYYPSMGLGVILSVLFILIFVGVYALRTETLQDGSAVHRTSDFGCGCGLLVITPVIGRFLPLEFLWAELCPLKFPTNLI